MDLTKTIKDFNINRGQLISARAAAITTAMATITAAGEQWGQPEQQWGKPGQQRGCGDSSWARGDAMITIRTRDKFVVINEAPKRV